MTGPDPVDRGESGSKLHKLSGRSGIPIAVAVPAATTPDAEALLPAWSEVSKAGKATRGQGL